MNVHLKVYGICLLIGFLVLLDTLDTNSMEAEIDKPNVVSDSIKLALLMSACYNDDVEKVQDLLESGMSDDSMCVVLIKLIIKNHHLDMIRVFLDYGLSDSSKEKLLNMACLHNRLEVVKILLAHLSTTVLNDSFFIAACQNNAQIMEAILKKSEISAQTIEESWAAIDFYKYVPSAQVLFPLLSQLFKTNIFLTDTLPKIGTRCFFEGDALWSIHLMRIFLMDILRNENSAISNTIIGQVVRYSNNNELYGLADCLRLLIDSSHTLNEGRLVDNNGSRQTALMWAVVLDQRSIVEELLERHLPQYYVYATNVRGHSALTCAAVLGRTYLVDVFINQGYLDFRRAEHLDLFLKAMRYAAEHGFHRLAVNLVLLLKGESSIAYF